MNASSFLAVHGATLAENGYRILPIKPGEKAPGRWDTIVGEWRDAADWSRFCERDPTELEIAEWEQWPQAGIGIACGNVVGIDIDVLDAGLAHRCQELAHEILGETPAVRFGKRPKRMLVYRCDRPFASFDARPLQVYALGRQFVAHGIHPETLQPYDWPLGSLREIDRSALPVVTEEKARAWAIAAAKILPGARPPAPPSAARAAGEHEPATYEAVEQALRFIPSDASVSRPDWVGIGMAIKAGLGEAGAPLWHSWSSHDARYTEKEADAQWRSFKNDRAGGIGIGTLFDKAKHGGWHPDGVFLYQRDADAAHAQVQIDYDALVSNIIKRTGVKPVEVEPVYTVPSGEPGWLRDLTGGLRLFVEHATVTAIRPQPWVALGGAISMFGALAGRRYSSPTNLRTNVYSIGIADSGGGKNHPLRLVSTVLAQAGLERFLGGEKIASGSGLIAALERNPSAIFTIDEIGFLMHAAADRRRSPGHKTEILDNLTQFYSTAAYTFLGTEYADQKEKPRRVIEQPCLCLYGLTTPSVFWGSLSSSNTLDGSLARMLIFESPDSYPDANRDIIVSPAPDDLVAVMRAVADGADGHVALGLGEGPQVRPTPYVVEYEDQLARARAADIDIEQTRLLRSYAGTPLTSIIARLGENAVKVALIRAISDNPPQPKLSVADLEWGYDIARQSVDTLLKAIEERVADNEHEAALKRVFKIVCEAGSAGIDRSTLTRRTQWLRDAKHRRSILDDLVEAGTVRCANTGLDPARPAVVYFAV